jgi:penicillin-binding protein 1C
MKRTLQAAVLLAVLITGYKAFWLLSLQLFPLPAVLEQDYSTLSLDPDGRLLRISLSPRDKYRIRLPLSQMDEHLKKGFLLYEDRYFYRHPGINPFAILRSALANIRNQRVIMGGSTITMQIAKLMEPKRRTWKAKIIEGFRALQLEAAYSKDELFELYLNTIPMGGNIEGVGAASYLYYGKPAQHLSFGEIALLIGLPRSPNSYRPDLHPQAAQLQKVKIMNRIGPPLGISPAVILGNVQAPLPRNRFSNPFSCPHLVVRTRALKSEPIHRHTIIPSLQAHCEALLRKTVDGLRKERSYNGAVIVIDNKTMKVLAYVGSPDFNDAEHGGQINGAAIWRSPGSLLKPFLYASAIDQGVLTPRKVLFDIERNYDGYIPANFDRRFLGPVPAEEALARSLNVPAINLEFELGQSGLAALVRKSRLGDPRRRPGTAGLSLVLGAYPFTLEDLVRFYSVFANKGFLRDLVFFEEDADRPNQGFQLLSPESCFIMAEVLSKLERPDLPQSWEFTPSRGKIAFKTGTSFGLRDAWTIGFNPDYTVGVWLGNVDSKGSSALVGIQAAAPVVVSIFNDLTRYDDHWFKKPERVHSREVCAVSGQPAGPFCGAKIRDSFIPGISQNIACSVHRRLTVRKKDGVEVCAACMTGPRSAYAEKIVQVWMPDVASFLRQKGFSTVLMPRHNPTCQAARNDRGLKIRSPMAGGYYAVTDVLEGTAQKIPLMLQSQSGTEKVYWFIDDVFLGQGSPDQTHYLKPVPGRHRLSVVDGRGQFDSVEFFVRRKW